MRGTFCGGWQLDGNGVGWSSGGRRSMHFSSCARCSRASVPNGKTICATQRRLMGRKMWECPVKRWASVSEEGQDRCLNCGGKASASVRYNSVYRTVRCWSPTRDRLWIENSSVDALGHVDIRWETYLDSGIGVVEGSKRRYFLLWSKA